MAIRRRELPILGGILLVVLLPLVFNPFIAQPFESSKVVCLRVVTIAILADMFLRRGPGWGQSVESRMSRLGGSAAPVVLYVVLYGIATAASVDVGLSLWGSGNLHGTVTTLLIIAFFILFVSSIKFWGQIDRVVNAIIVGSVPVALYGWVQFLGYDPLAWETSSISPVHSTLGRSVFLGAYLAMVVPFTLARLVATVQKGVSRRVFALGFIVLLQVGCLFFTLARGAWLGFLAAVFFFVVLALARRRVWMWGILALTGAALALFAVISQFGGTIFPESAGVASGDRFLHMRSSSNVARLTTWRDAIELIPERWLVGYGPETYAKAASAAGLVNASSTDAWMHQDDPHNVWLYHLTAVGAGGLMAFVWLIARFYRQTLTSFARYSGPEKKLLLAAIVSSMTGYLIQAQFNPDVITLTLFFWICLGLGFAAANLPNANHTQVT